MRILVIGQATVHWGRQEFGNIGNFYIVEPFFRELHRVFPGAEIVTTLQMSEQFCRSSEVTRLPMGLYYSWSGEDLDQALKELGIASVYHVTGHATKVTPYIDEVLRSDLVIDLSGDIWGDNANFLGENRLIVGLIKDRVAQLLRKPVVMLAGSPGPFTDSATLGFAHEVFQGFRLVTNREPWSEKVLLDSGFDVSRVRSLACPAFLFDAQGGKAADAIIRSSAGYTPEVPVVGFILCGWNFSEGPFNKWPRPDGDYLLFAELIEHITAQLGLQVCLMSHSNGFRLPPEPFELIHGRDYSVIKQLQNLVLGRGVTDKVYALDGVYDAWTTKAIIGQFDMLVSGRVHGAVAGLSQGVPTVIIDYGGGQGPKAHKLRGFAEVAQVSEYVVDPADLSGMFEGVSRCWQDRSALRERLARRMPLVKALARANFDVLADLFKEDSQPGGL